MQYPADGQSTELFYYALSALILLAGYLLPTIVAFGRGHTRKGAILFLNVIIGWTGFGWLYLMLTAMGFI